MDKHLGESSACKGNTDHTALGFSLFFFKMTFIQLCVVYFVTLLFPWILIFSGFSLNSCKKKKKATDDCLHIFIMTLGSTGTRQANQKTKYESTPILRKDSKQITAYQNKSTGFSLLILLYFILFFNTVNHSPGGTCRKSAFNTQNKKWRQKGMFFWFKHF